MLMSGRGLSGGAGAEEFAGVLWVVAYVGMNEE